MLDNKQKKNNNFKTLGVEIHIKNRFVVRKVLNVFANFFLFLVRFDIFFLVSAARNKMRKKLPKKL